MHAPHLLCLSVAMVCKMLLNALLYWQPHTLCPALMEQFTFPQVQCASVSKVVIQILYWHTHKHKCFWGNRKIQVWKATKNITLMNPASVSSSGCIMASTSCCSECNCSCGWVEWVCNIYIKCSVFIGKCGCTCSCFLELGERVCCMSSAVFVCVIMLVCRSFILFLN